MAKLLDKLYNRLIEGKLKIESDDDVESLKETLGLDGKANIHYVTDFIDNENPDFSDMQSGDLIFDDSYPLIGFIRNIRNGTISISGVDDTGEFMNCFYHDETWEIASAPLNSASLFASLADAGKFLQVQSDGRVLPAAVSGGTKLYKHSVNIEANGDSFDVTIIDKYSTNYSQTTIGDELGSTLTSITEDAISLRAIDGGIVFSLTTDGHTFIKEIGIVSNAIGAVETITLNDYEDEVIITDNVLPL